MHDALSAQQAEKWLAMCVFMLSCLRLLKFPYNKGKLIT